MAVDVRYVWGYGNFPLFDAGFPAELEPRRNDESSQLGQA
jgi:hypothetical protein